VAVFLSTFLNKVDKKGRVSVPASFRAQLAAQEFAGIVAFPSFRFEALDCCGLDRMLEMSARHDALDQFSEEHENLALIFAQAQQIPFDGEGRISLPEELCAHAGITETVAFVGHGKTFQIWEPDRLALHSAEARKRAQRTGLTLPALGAAPRAPQPAAGPAP
jgi:MraZ protein